MNKHFTSEEVRKLPVEEHLRLMEDVWASLEVEGAELAVPEWHKSELDLRLESHRSQPDKAQNWPDVKAEILDGLRK